MCTFKPNFDRLQNKDNPLTRSILSIIEHNQGRGIIMAQQAIKLCDTFSLRPLDLALNALDVAACYAQAPVSHFFVGAIAQGVSGTLYFGANQEYSDHAMGHTVHAEQSAISHAWHAGEKAVSDIVVNYTPCGHCRQFMNELNTSETLQIHLPHQCNNMLKSYLPDSFGPSDLGISHRLFDPPRLKPLSITKATSALMEQALIALILSYAPYTHAYSAVALELANGAIITGRYAENAAFNPSLMPLQSALNLLLLSTPYDKRSKIIKILLVEKKARISHKESTFALAHSLGAQCSYHSLD